MVRQLSRKSREAAFQVWDAFNNQIGEGFFPTQNKIEKKEKISLFKDQFHEMPSPKQAKHKKQRN